MKSTDLQSFNNSWYSTGAGSVKRILWYFVNCLFFINPLFPINSIKIFLLKLFGAKIGKNVLIKPSVNIKYPWKLIVGNYVWIGENAWIDNLDIVIIGNNCCISQGALLLSGNHDYTKTSFDLKIGKIVLEDGVWIGAKSIVCQNVTCRSHSILTVNSVVTRDLEAYSIYRGNPAEKIRDRKIE